MNLNKEVADQLRTAADDIENNRCGLNQNEIQDLASVVMHIEMNKSEAANYLGLSIRTFDRYIANGWIPRGIRPLGSNSLVWYKDELAKADYK